MAGLWITNALATRWTAGSLITKAVITYMQTNDVLADQERGGVPGALSLVPLLKVRRPCWTLRVLFVNPLFALAGCCPYVPRLARLGVASSLDGSDRHQLVASQTRSARAKRLLGGLGDGCEGTARRIGSID